MTISFQNLNKTLLIAYKPDSNHSGSGGENISMSFSVAVIQVVSDHHDNQFSQLGMKTSLQTHFVLHLHNSCATRQPPSSNSLLEVIATGWNAEAGVQIYCNDELYLENIFKRKCDWLLVSIHDLNVMIRSWFDEISSRWQTPTHCKNIFSCTWLFIAQSSATIGSHFKYGGYKPTTPPLLKCTVFFCNFEGLSYSN